MLDLHFFRFTLSLPLTTSFLGAPARCSARVCVSVAARRVRSGDWLSWEKNTLHFPGYFSAGSASQRGSLDGHRNTSASLSKGLLRGRDKQLGTDQLFEPCLKMITHAPVPAQGGKQE